MSAETREILTGNQAPHDEAFWPTATGAAPRTDVGVDRASWLSDDVLFLVVSGEHVLGPVEAFAASDLHTVPLSLHVLPYRQPGIADPPGRLTHVLLLRLPEPDASLGLLRLGLRVANDTVWFGPAELSKALVDWRTLLRSELAALEPAARADMLAFLVQGPEAIARPRPVGVASRERAKELDERRLARRIQLSRSLNAAREALRERLPISVVSVAAPSALQADAILALDDHSFYVQGWMRDAQAAPRRLTAVSPEGSRAELLPCLFRHHRPDVSEYYGDVPDERSGAEHGWIAYLETPIPSVLASGWTFEMGNTAGAQLEAAGPPVTRDPATVRDMILADLRHERFPADRLRSEHIRPALTRLEERRHSSARVDSVDQHGRAPASPVASVIVPLYGRIDFLEYQLAQFALDPELQRADLIYILDSPELADAFRNTAAQLAQLYPVAFRAVVMSHNVGFSGVNNMGADLARARFLLLLNSDVFPRAPGWLGAMTRFYEDTPGIGALAPKLLYEDDSLQHAGLYFKREVNTGLWNNEHYYKGLHRSLPAANVARPVPAVTGACLMIETAMYREIGGLRGMYIQGDYEDSDLCLRLSRAGRQNWYFPHVELYHLEGQSYPSEERHVTGAYNKWLHSHTWSEEMSVIMEILK
jgi:GT2 family glycosyltransferase